MTLRFALSPFVLIAAVAALGAAGAGCGGPQAGSGCKAETWSGHCTLRGVTLVEDAELPVPHVVLEAIYAPQENPLNPNFTPPEVRRQYKALARDEDALRAHLAQYADVACELKPPPPGVCAPGEMVANVPEFSPGASSAQNEPQGPQGCDQIEAAASQNRLAEVGKQSGSDFPDPFTFSEGSSTPSPEAGALAQSVAGRLGSGSSFECVGLVGQVSRGENLGLAEQRARAIRQLLIERGADPKKLITISATTPVFGAGPDAPPPDPKDRRVLVRVLLRAGTPPTTP